MHLKVENQKGDVYIRKGYKLLSILLILLFIGMPAANASTITHYGMNSCSNGWYHTGGTFENYCPFCGGHGTLTFNPKGTPEGEFTCSRCDSDFCLCGRCKATGSSVYLIKASATVTKTAAQPVQQTPVQNTIISVNPIKQIQNMLNENWSLF